MIRNNNDHYSEGNMNNIVEDAMQAGAGFRGDAIPASESLATFTGKTFLWMFAGLLVTFITAFYFAASGAVNVLFASNATVWLLPIAEIAVVFILSFSINKISPAVAAGLFMLYSVLTGLTFSELFILFNVGTVIFVFAISAIYFGIMAAISLIFKVRLGGFGNFLLGALIMLLAMQLISLFVPGLNKLVCLAGIAIFSGCTAYDTSKIKDYYYSCSSNSAILKKASIISALNLYLDFINIFIYMLRLTGNSSSNN